MDRYSSAALARRCPQDGSRCDPNRDCVTRAHDEFLGCNDGLRPRSTQICIIPQEFMLRDLTNSAHQNDGMAYAHHRALGYARSLQTYLGVHAAHECAQFR